MIVADTNLVAYLFLETPFSVIAESVVKKDPQWTAPRLWISEFRNVLALHLRKKTLNAMEAVQLAEKAESFVKSPPQEPSPQHILSLAGSSRLSAYDCEFVALAHTSGLPLITSDSGILKAFPGLAVSPREFAAD